MKELIRITEQNGKKAVSARELHAFLESNRDFTDWIKYRIKQYDFIENQDYVILPQICGKIDRGRPSVEYALTVNMAKELSMVEGNAKGKQARRYFIACEEKAILLLSNQDKNSISKNMNIDILNLSKQCPELNITVKAGDLAEMVEYCINRTRKNLEQIITDVNTETYPSVAKVAEILGVDKSTLWRWGKRNYLNHVSIGGKRRYRMSDVRRILEAGNQS